MLCGVGGNTIEEAQQRIGYPEFLKWAAYRRKRGSLNVGTRIDRSVAQIASLYANAHYKREGGGEYTAFDFMPYADPPPPITLETAMESWS